MINFMYWSLCNSRVACSITLRACTRHSLRTPPAEFDTLLCPAPIVERVLKRFQCPSVCLTFPSVSRMLVCRFIQKLR